MGGVQLKGKSRVCSNDPDKKEIGERREKKREKEQLYLQGKAAVSRYRGDERKRPDACGNGCFIILCY